LQEMPFREKLRSGWSKRFTGLRVNCSHELKLAEESAHQLVPQAGKGNLQAWHNKEKVFGSLCKLLVCPLQAIGKQARIVAMNNVGGSLSVRRLYFDLNIAISQLYSQV